MGTPGPGGEGAAGHEVLRRHRPGQRVRAAAAAGHDGPGRDPGRGAGRALPSSRWRRCSRSDGRHVCYVAAGRRAPGPREVVLGPSNQDFVVVEKGLRRGERVCLRDPGPAASRALRLRASRQSLGRPGMRTCPRRSVPPAARRSRLDGRVPLLLRRPRLADRLSSPRARVAPRHGCEPASARPRPSSPRRRRPGPDNAPSACCCSRPRSAWPGARRQGGGAGLPRRQGAARQPHGRALYERARRELLKGRRQGEAGGPRSGGAGPAGARASCDGAERIVDLGAEADPRPRGGPRLFGRLKERRLRPGTAEAEAERELEKPGPGAGRQARPRRAPPWRPGWERTALLTLRRGLRLAPDHPELLALLGELQSAWTKIDAPTRAAPGAATRRSGPGLDLLLAGQLDESLRILRAVLVEDSGQRAGPGRGPGGAAGVAAPDQLVRSAPGVLLAAPLAPRPSAPAAAPPLAPRPTATVAAAPRRPGRLRPRPPPSRFRIPPAAAGAPDDGTRRRAARGGPEVLLPRTRRAHTLGSHPGRRGLVFLVLVVFTTWSRRRNLRWPPPCHLQPPGPRSLPSTTTEPPAPSPTWSRAARASSKRSWRTTPAPWRPPDAALLAQARPDLSPAEREQSCSLPSRARSTWPPICGSST